MRRWKRGKQTEETAREGLREERGGGRKGECKIGRERELKESDLKGKRIAK